MKAQALKGTRYMVYWRSKVLMQDRVLRNGVIQKVCKEGFVMRFPQAVSLGVDVNLEFYVSYKEEQCRIRVKTSVVACMLLSGGLGADLELQIVTLSKDERHTLNNVLQLLENSSEFNLRAP